MSEDALLLFVTLEEKQVETVDFMTVENIDEGHRSVDFAAYHETTAEADGEVYNLSIEINGLR